VKKINNSPNEGPLRRELTIVQMKGQKRINNCPNEGPVTHPRVVVRSLKNFLLENH
jgi:hypothetical protein